MNPKNFNSNELAIIKATGVQCATLGQMVAVALTKKFEGILSFSQAQIAITDKKQLDVNQLAEKFANEIFSILIDPWFEEKRKISLFYKTCFKDNKWKNPNWDQVTFPTIKGDLKRPDFFFIETMTEDDVLDAYDDYFGKDKVWKEWNYKLTKVINRETVQSRPKKNYVGLHVGGDEPDLLGKSYDDGISEKIIFMTPLEGIISAFRYQFETEKMYNLIGVTRLSALDRNDHAMHMYGNTNGKFHLHSSNRVSRDPGRGLRQICF